MDQEGSEGGREGIMNIGRRDNREVRWKGGIWEGKIEETHGGKRKVRTRVGTKEKGEREEVRES